MIKTNKKTFAILIDTGIPMSSKLNDPVDWIEAETAKEARETFKKKWEGHPAAAGTFKATRVG